MSIRMPSLAKAARATAFTPAPHGLTQRRLTLDRRAESPETQPAPMGTGWNFDRFQVHHVAPQAVQTQLIVNEPGDKYEQEAEQVADEVMRMPALSQPQSASPFQHGTDPSIQRLCSECEEEMQRRPGSAQQGRSQAQPGLRRSARGQAESIAAPPIVKQVVSSAGVRLDPATRAFMEPRLGHDFGRVRVHTDGRAADSAEAVQARAYTVGDHVVFGKHQFSPASSEGRRLLAHELTHVIQQSESDTSIVPEEDEGTEISALQDHETIAADETVAGASRQSTPKLNSGLMLQRAACPCCADSISIGNVSRIDTAERMGHNFDVTFGLGYPASGPSGSCTLEWWERTNVPYTAGMSANTWTNMFALVPTSPTFSPWNNRTESCGSTQAVTITDVPSLARRPGRTVIRTLEFRIVINSMPATSASGCSGATQEVTATQVLAMVNGAPDWSASSFTTP